MRREAALSLCKMHWLGNPQQRRRGREVLDQLAREDVLLAEYAACTRNPFATGLINVPN